MYNVKQMVTDCHARIVFIHRKVLKDETKSGKQNGQIVSRSIVHFWHQNQLILSLGKAFDKTGAVSLM